MSMLSVIGRYECTAYTVQNGEYGAEVVRPQGWPFGDSPWYSFPLGIRRSEQQQEALADVSAKWLVTSFVGEVNPYHYGHPSHPDVKGPLPLHPSSSEDLLYHPLRKRNCKSTIVNSGIRLTLLVIHRVTSIHVRAAPASAKVHQKVRPLLKTKHARVGAKNDASHVGHAGVRF